MKLSPYKYTQIAKENNKVYKEIHHSIESVVRDGTTFLELDEEYQDDLVEFDSAISLLTAEGFKIEMNESGDYTLSIV